MTRRIPSSPQLPAAGFLLRGALAPVAASLRAPAIFEGASLMQTNTPKDERYERKTSTANQPYFVLKAGNGEVIGRSEMYSSTGARDNGIESVKKNGPTTDIRDET